MMIKLKRLYKHLIKEATTGTITVTDPNKAEELARKGLDVSLKKDLEEAELVNHMYDYRGGVEYVLRDPAQAQETIESITRWTERKGFVIITKNISKSGRVGYFHFRLGPDPERDAQRIQGYFSSKIEIAKYRFKVRNPRKRRRVRQPQPEI